MWWFRTHIRDDRGRTRPPRWSPADAALDASLTTDQRRNEARHARLIATDRIARSRWLVLVLWVPAAGLCVWGYSLGWRVSHEADFFTLGVLSIAGTTHAMLRFIARPRLRAMRTAAQRLVPLRCAVCGYALEGLNIEPDGCRVCPECGAAWRAVQAPGAGVTAA